MYLIHIPAERAGVDHWLFFDVDPRRDGCTSEVMAGVDFIDLGATSAGRGGSSTTKMPVLARSVQRPHFRLFPCRIAVPFDYEFLEGFAFHFVTWSDFMASPIAKDEDWRPIQTQTAARVEVKPATTNSHICVSIRPEGMWWETGDRLSSHTTSRLYGRWLNSTEFETEQGPVLVCPPKGPEGYREGPVAWRELARLSASA